MHKLATTCLIAFGLSTLTTVTAPAALAATGSAGRCYGEMRAAATGAFSGWCDGPGTQIYRAYVICSDRHSYVGGWHWFGDRRGSLAVCASGATGTNAGFQFRRLVH
ncbi:MAG TPA: hypothetical protein VFX70_17725 [Mycobacteriales bacterium]|nr:hypothetical protein [Mycobacteriales bacterium]